MTTAVIMQPTYLPWIGYFDLMDQADIFVFLDDAQFSKQSWHHRNRIRTSKGLEWLTVPIRRTGRSPLLISAAEIAVETGYARKCVRAIEVNYCRTPFFDRYFPQLSDIHLAGKERLADLTVSLVKYLAAALGISTAITMNSEIGGEGRRSDLMADICCRVGADRCLQAAGSAPYLAKELDREGQAGVQLSFHQFDHPKYHQVHSPFLPFASAIDLLFNEGDAALSIIRSGRRRSLSASEVFSQLRNK
jgi:hypothetical protein